MRIRSVVTIAATVLFATAAEASEVRMLSLPDSVLGSWAPSADACDGSAPGKVDVGAKTHSDEDMSCEVSWVTVTASRDGPVYSARSICTQSKSGKKLEPSYFLITPRPDNKVLLRMPFAPLDKQLVTYQKCS